MSLKIALVIGVLFTYVLYIIYRKLTDTHNIDRPNPFIIGFGLSMFIFWVVAIPIAPTPTIIKLRNLLAHNLVTFKAKFN